MNTKDKLMEKIEEKIELEDCAVGSFEAVMEPCSPQPNQYDKYVSTDYPCENRWTVPYVCMPLDEFKALLTSEIERIVNQAIGIVNEKVRWAKGANPDEVYEALSELKGGDTK